MKLIPTLKLKPEDYCVGKFGLYKMYEPILFTLLSRTHTAFFSYEEETTIPKLHKISNVEQYKSALTPKVMRWLCELPRKPEFGLETILEPNLETIIELRLLQWKKYHRGKLSGNVVQFRSALTVQEDQYLTEALKCMLK